MPASHDRWQTPHLYVISTCFYTLRISCLSKSYSSVATKRKLWLWFQKLGDSCGRNFWSWESEVGASIGRARPPVGTSGCWHTQRNRPELNVYITTDDREKTGPRAGTSGLSWETSGRGPQGGTGIWRWGEEDLVESQEEEQEKMRGSTESVV